MRRLVIKEICVAIVIIILIVCMTITANSYSVYTYSAYNNCDNVTMLRNENQIYLIGYSDKDVYIDAVYPKSYNVTLTLNNDVYSYNLCGDTLVLVCPDKERRQNEIVLYNLSNDSFVSFNTTDDAVHESTQIAYNNGYVYLSCHNGSIKQYTTKGKLCNEYELGKHALYLMSDYNGNVYATSYSGVYKLTDSCCVKISGAAIDSACRFVDDNIFVTASGYAYKISNEVVNRLISFRHTMSHPSGGTYKKNIISAQNNTIYAVSIASDKAIKSISLSNNIEQLYVIDDTVIALAYCDGCATISKIPYLEFKDIKTAEEDGFNSSGDISNSELSDSNYSISSDIYTVDNKNYTISGIASPTTVAQFKRNMNYEGFDVEFVRYGGQGITSGNVGTATVARFYNDSFVYEYELCVEGDLTGEGNVNSRDENVMFDCLLDNMEVFNGVFVQAANLDDSEHIDITDLVLLLRMIESNK